MPDYNYTVTVPANTSKDNPQVTECKLTRGILAGGQIFFPHGCNGMVHVVICDGSGQLYPANAEDTFHGNASTVELVGRHKLDSAPYKLYIKAWSPNTRHSHSIQVTLHVLSEEELNPSVLLRDILDLLRQELT